MKELKSDRSWIIWSENLHSDYVQPQTPPALPHIDRLVLTGGLNSRGNPEFLTVRLAIHQSALWVCCLHRMCAQDRAQLVKYKLRFLVQFAKVKMASELKQKQRTKEAESQEAVMFKHMQN